MDHRQEVHLRKVFDSLNELRKRLESGNFKKDVLLEMCNNAQHPEDWLWLRQAVEAMPN